MTYFSLRGLCKGLEELVDSQFVVNMNAADSRNGLAFTGFTKSVITLNKTNNRWNAVSLKDGSVIMELDLKVSDIVK